MSGPYQEKPLPPLVEELPIVANEGDELAMFDGRMLSTWLFAGGKWIMRSYARAPL